MRNTLFTMILMLVLGGSIFAQETHWPGFDEHDYDMSGPIVAYVQIDGQYITNSMNFASIEVCPFVGEEQRGFGWFMVDFGLSYPVIWGSIFYDLQGGDAGKPVSFKMFDHESGIEYDICTTSPESIVTGGDYADFENMAILNFTCSLELTVEPYTENGGYYLIASPIGSVDPEDVGQMLSNNYDLYYFDQTKAKEWVNYKTGGEGEVNNDPGFSLEPGKGYLYANSEEVTLTFTGAPYNETGEVTLTKTDATVDFQGWNLVGNPFAQTAYIAKPFYVMNGDRTDLTPATDNSVEAMEGLFVVADEDGETLTFSTEPSKGNQQLVINLNSNNRGGAIDRAIIRFNKENSLPKFQLNPNNTKVYIPQNGNDYAVVHAESEGELPVNFKASKNGSYSFNFNAEEVDVNYLHLIDNLTGADVDLKSTPSYTFQAKTTDYASRFKLVFAIDRTNDESFAFFNNDNWFISNDGKALLQVIDLNGRLLSNEQISGSVSKHIDAAPGVYVMRLINGDNVKTQKVVVR